MNLEHREHHIEPEERMSSARADDIRSMGHAGHDHHAMMINDFKKRFWISLVITVPVLLLSGMIQHWLGFEIKFTFVLEPAVGAVFMSLSTIVVAINAQLQKFRLVAR